VRDADVIQLMGHWSILNALVYCFARRYGKPYLVSPAGTLAQAGRSLWLKRLYNALVGRRMVREASGWIAVTSGEFPDFERYGIARERVTVLPNGVELRPVATQPAAEEFAARFAPYILYVGRLHPVKGPDLLLDAFRTIGERFTRHRLVFIGPDDGIRAALEETARSFAQGERVVFLGYRDGAEKDALFRNAQLLVIPSRSEAMSLVALEAAAVATPVVLTDRCGFDEIAQVDSRLVVPATAEDIARAVCELLETPPDLARIGQALQAHVAGRFGWSTVIDRFVRLCEGLARCAR
jgi:glycosyltransferase involved in cell wall biosynthesis